MSENGEEAGGAPGRRAVDGDDAAAGDRREDESGVGQAIVPALGGVGRLAGDLKPPVHPVEGPADRSASGAQEGGRKREGRPLLDHLDPRQEPSALKEAYTGGPLATADRIDLDTIH